MSLQVLGDHQLTNAWI